MQRCRMTCYADRSKKTLLTSRFIYLYLSFPGGYDDGRFVLYTNRVHAKINDSDFETRDIEKNNNDTKTNSRVISCSMLLLKNYYEKFFPPKRFVHAMFVHCYKIQTTRHYLYIIYVQSSKYRAFVCVLIVSSTTAMIPLVPSRGRVNPEVEDRFRVAVSRRVLEYMYTYNNVSNALEIFTRKTVEM